MSIRSLLTVLALAGAACAASAQSLCSSDRQARPAAVLERFINADCATCWSDPAVPAAGPRELALDWIVPSPRGDEALLSAAQTRDALARLDRLQRTAPAGADTVRTAVASARFRLRLAQGVPLNDYIGISIELRPAAALRVWLLLVEELPAGTEGSAVARNLVRGVFRPDWEAAAPAGQSVRREARSMHIPEGTQPERLRLVALAEDTRGHIRAIARTGCTAPATP